VLLRLPLPERVADLVAALANLERDDLLHVELINGKDRKKWQWQKAAT
jgi:hypothetical protein